MSKLRNEFSKVEISLINRRAHQLASTTFLLFQQALMRDLMELKRLGVEVTLEVVQGQSPAIADDLAAFEEAGGA